MNRGRRRGGPGLTGLRDGVKRRLFDPHLVPIKPDAKYEVNRLVPLTSTKPVIQSRLENLRTLNIDEISEKPAANNPSDKLKRNIINSKALFELAFRKGPFYHPLPVLPEGIDMNRAFGGLSSTDKLLKVDSPVLLAHLLLAHEFIKDWGEGEPLRELEDPESWYPKELVQFTKPGKRSAMRLRAKKKLAAQTTKVVTADLEELVPDQFIQRAAEAVEGADDDVTERPEVDQKQQDSDSDDARWNGEVNAEADPDDLDEEELDNDYCQTYFDNGEGDLSEDGLGGEDDDGGAKYYD
ncbi:hypothetical protein EG68_09717 [Paragonimus skrjabini miyazakii]|uniref:DNA-directed RNA polymerase III subunit n=1 Tax=Paragonimus skrjabini miyazakii TaxID=59628 RepID=A0A8S9YSQ1_9TREM|nr:hypothetical protein EG68_09717 [Paragonimus skrjabini miyazakii]